MSGNIIYVGVNDTKISMFENQYPIEHGMAYNSYVISGNSTAVIDSVGEGFGDEWLSYVGAALNGGDPDYLIVQHMEPDHSANIRAFMSRYPNAQLVSSAKTFAMIANFYGVDYSQQGIIVGDNDTLDLGNGIVLRFITAPMVHWPEVIMTYSEADKAIFSADAFGKFGSLDHKEDWACEARRYYFGIVGKYGAQVQNVLKKLAALDINAIYPLHGPVLKNDLKSYISLYDTWSSYYAEDVGVTIAYCSIYGHTQKAAEMLAEKLDRAHQKVSLFDLANCDVYEAVEDAFKYDKLVLASPTYNGDVMPYMRSFINHLKDRNYQNRFIALIENGSWAPMAAKIMREEMEGCKNMRFAKNTVRILSSLNEDSQAKLAALSLELCIQN